MNAKFLTKGNGTAIHIAYYEKNFDLTGATYCDKFGGSSYNMGGNRKGRVNVIEAEAPTCKRCIKIEKAGE